MLWLLLVPLLRAGPAPLFHPELLQLGERPALIDCPHDFRQALLAYFTHHAPAEGLPSGEVALTELSRDSDRWTSRFAAAVGPHRYRGFVYLEPPLGDDDDEIGPPLPPRRGDRYCSAVFAEEPVPAAVAAKLESAYRALCAHFGVAP